MGTAKVNDFAVTIAKKAVNSFRRAHRFTLIQDDLFLKELFGFSCDERNCK